MIWHARLFYNGALIHIVHGFADEHHMHFSFIVLMDFLPRYAHSIFIEQFCRVRRVESLNDDEWLKFKFQLKFYDLH
jgi:hypothetical protein